MARASKENETRRLREILARLKRRYPDTRCALRHRTPLQLLVATILSAQCTDERVNKVTPALFKKYPNVRSFADADLSELEQDIRSTGFFRNKARAIKGAAEKIVADYSGRVPKTMEELLTLPGVARKTANVVLGTAYGTADGVVVDTHVARLSQRLGFSRQADPKKIERDLMERFPQEEWINLAFLLIDHGRAICHARKPKCQLCFLTDICRYYQKAYKNG